MKVTRQHLKPLRSPKKRKTDKDRQPLMAEAMTGPFLPSALALHSFAAGSAGEIPLECVLDKMVGNALAVNGGSMRDVEAFLISQATALNAIFAELCRRSWANLSGGQFETGEQYLRLALRAQSQSRATFETLSTVKNPPAVFARQANVASQQVNNFIAPSVHVRENHSAPNKQLQQPDDAVVALRAPNLESAGYSSKETMEPLEVSRRR